MATIKCVKLRRDYFEKKKFKVSHLIGKPVEAQFNYFYSKMPNDTKKIEIKANQSLKYGFEIQAQKKYYKVEIVHSQVFYS